MIRLLDNSKISIITYFLIFTFIAVYAGHASLFAYELGDIRTLGNAFALGLTVIFILRNKIYFRKDYCIVIGVFLIYALITAVVYRIMNFWWISVHVLLITYAYVISKVAGPKLIVLFETILYHLSIIALLFWMILIVSPDLLDLIVRTFQFSQPQTEDGNVLASMIIYTLQNYDYGSAEFNLSFLRRNPGFMWEPGAYASMICIAIFCNVLRNKGFVLLKNKALWIFLIALFSTQSTTGFSIFVIMLIGWVFTSGRKGWGIVLVPLSFALFKLSFFGEKLLFQQENVKSLDITNAHGQQDRFFSLLIDWQEFLLHPVIGLGCNWQNTWLAMNGYEISTVSGIGDLLATYGGIIAVLFIVMLYKTSLAINREYNTRNGFILIPIILGVLISYSMWTYPIIIAIWLYGIWGAKSLPNNQSIVKSRS